jgi:hypothetical protein
MRLIIPLLLVPNFVFGSGLEAYISTQKSFIWSQPGYNWKDCRLIKTQDEDIYKLDGEEKSLAEKRYNEGGKAICLQREKDRPKNLLNAGDRVEVIDGSETPPMDVIIGGKLMQKKFYRVKSESGYEGWISEDQITEPKAIEPKATEPKGKLFPKENKEVCETKPKLGADKLKSEAGKIGQAVDQQIQLGKLKNDDEIKKFMCLYRHHKISKDEFDEKFDVLHNAAKDAANSFKVPYGMIMCTMLVESGLYHDPNEKDEYRGITQFGSMLVEDLNQATKRQPYSEMWKSYKSKNKSAEISDINIREESEPYSSAAAVAMAMKWIYNDRFKDKKVNCKDCSKDGNYNRKDLYLMIAGYNWGPYAIHKISQKSAFEMRNTSPPPKETRDYMERMENCWTKGHFKNFREDTYRIEQINQQRELAINKQIKSLEEAKGTLKKSPTISKETIKSYDNHPVIKQKLTMISMGASLEYEKRLNECSK